MIDNNPVANTQQATMQQEFDEKTLSLTAMREKHFLHKSCTAPAVGPLPARRRTLCEGQNN